MDTVALIVAAGRGARFAAEIPKQYAGLMGRPVIQLSVETFARHPDVDAVQVMIGPGDERAYARALDGLDLLPPLIGGASRQETVRVGLERLAAAAPRRVLIHDAARPLVSRGIISRVLDGLRHHDAVLPALPAVDSLRRVADGQVVGEASRDGLVHAQTPQGFRFAPILAAHRAAAGGRAFTDDVAVAAAAGIEVGWVAGERSNMKVTLPGDLEAAETYLRAGTRWRTGFGLDVHAFAPDRPLILCGVRIPHEVGLAGHSDADAPLHAVTDAVLGAIGAGDIGEHFPPSDPRWRDADSAVFLRHATALLAARGGAVENVDLVIVCERPRIGPHRDAMRSRLAALLDLAPDRVGIKATTSEAMGFTGRGEGLLAQAVVSVAMPR